MISLAYGHKKQIINRVQFDNTLSTTAFNLEYDTVVVNNHKTYHISTKALTKDLLLLRITSGTTVKIFDTISSVALFTIEFPDFNSDGNVDILTDYYGNNSTFTLYLFDTTKETYRKIEDYVKFPYSQQLKSNPKYYYSFEAAGCAGMDWESDLFKIENFVITQVGHIYANVCDDSQVVEIYKIRDNDESKEKLIKKIPYSTFKSKYGEGWDVIWKYWSKNYTRFE